MGARHGQAGAGASLTHKQFIDPVGAVEVFPTTNGGNVYGFLIEEPKDDPLYLLLIDKDTATIKYSYAAEGSKFGRDGQPFALDFFKKGLDIALSTSRTSIINPTPGATVHLWVATQYNT